MNKQKRDKTKQLMQEKQQIKRNQDVYLRNNLGIILVGLPYSNIISQERHNDFKCVGN